MSRLSILGFQMLTGFPQTSPDIKCSCLGLSPTQQSWKGFENMRISQWTGKAQGKSKVWPHDLKLGAVVSTQGDGR